jgi:hypothetical protein
MTCRETETLDLATFLARGTAPEFAAFRAHYPRCADCAAEVRAWTELHAALSASGHPSPDTLLRYEDGRLAQADRGAVAQHLGACAPCRDELRALGAFDRDAVRAARPAAVEPRRWLRLPAWGRLVMHPALAYGLVLALLFYPSLRGRAPEPSQSRGDDVPAQKVANEAEVSDRMMAAPARRERAAPAEQPAAEAPERTYGQPPAASARAKAAAGARESDAAPLAALGKAKGGGGAGVGLVLRGDMPVRLDAGSAGEWVTLRIPADPSSRSVDVRVIDQRTERQLRERKEPAGGWVEMEVPTAWLSAGRYLVEVHPLGGETNAFALEVDP